MRPGGSVGDDETSDGSTIASLPFPPDILAAVGDCAAFGGMVSPGSSEFLKRMAAEIRREIIAINRCTATRSELGTALGNNAGQNPERTGTAGDERG
jgi:hypothetical protein